MAFLFLMPSLNLRAYGKPPIATAALVAKLQGQGLQINDVAAATRLLEHVTYFRFRGYLYPYMDFTAPAPPAPRQYKAATTFEQVEQMYRFDEGLRRLVFDLLPCMEVALRSVLDSTMCHAAGHGFWYLQEEWFSKKARNNIDNAINKLGGDFRRSSEKFAVHYQDTYFNNWRGKYSSHPPFWMICELSTLGQVKEFYASLDENGSGFIAASPGVPKSTVLDKMAHKFGAAHYRELCTWVQVLRDVRNVCAHHGRLWNRNLMAPPGVTALVSVPFPAMSATNPQPNTNTIYAALVMTRVMHKRIGLVDTIKAGLTSLLTAYPEAANHLNAIGMPAGWDADTVWA